MKPYRHAAITIPYIQMAIVPLLSDTPFPVRGFLQFDRYFSRYLGVGVVGPRTTEDHVVHGPRGPKKSTLAGCPWSDHGPRKDHGGTTEDHEGPRTFRILFFKLFFVMNHCKHCFKCQYFDSKMFGINESDDEDINDSSGEESLDVATLEDYCEQEEGGVKRMRSSSSSSYSDVTYGTTKSSPPNAPKKAKQFSRIWDHFDAVGETTSENAHLPDTGIVNCTTRSSL